jgi:hypothetical protein
MNEVIMFTGVLSTSEDDKIQSYLACKYGITLSQATPRNYILSNNIISWNTNADASYRNNIGCIARDNSF